MKGNELVHSEKQSESFMPFAEPEDGFVSLIEAPADRNRALMACECDCFCDCECNACQMGCDDER